jgi:hypothetical protein
VARPTTRRAISIRSKRVQPCGLRSSSVERDDANKKTRAWGRPGLQIIQNWTDRSSRLRCGLLGYAFRLRAFLSLNNFEFDVIALLEALVSLRLDGTIVDEHIRAVIPADKAEALCVIEPFNFTFNSRHVPYSGAVVGRHDRTVVPRTSFSFSGFATFFGKDAGHRRFTFSRHNTSYTRTLALRLFCLHRGMMSTLSMYSRRRGAREKGSPAIGWRVHNSL